MENRLLSYFAAPDLALLTAHFSELVLKQGAVLHEPETLIETVYFPLSGAVSLLAVMKGGVAIEVANVGREGAVGLSTHSGVWLARTRATVRVPGSAKAIPSQLLKTIIGQNASIRERMVRYKQKLSAQTAQLAACNGLHSVEERLTRWLLQMLDRIDDIELPVTQQTLSQMLGVRRTTVTDAVHKLRRDGLIRYTRGNIVIVDPDGLHSLACECYEVFRRVEAQFR